MKVAAAAADGLVHREGLFAEGTVELLAKGTVELAAPRPDENRRGGGGAAAEEAAAAEAVAGGRRRKRPHSGAIPAAVDAMATDTLGAAAARQPDAFAFRVEHLPSHSSTAGSAARVPAGEWPSVRVVLEQSTKGEASAAFWRFAERMRNDVVRDTRQWRRRGVAPGIA